jgi:regulator of replication initiation timing
MWSGRDTLGSINQAISKLHREESSLDRALQSAMAEGERLRQERGRLMRELARVKLDEIAGGRLVSGLDAGERRAATLLEGRRARIARIFTIGRDHPVICAISNVLRSSKSSSVSTSRSGAESLSINRVTIAFASPSRSSGTPACRCIN